MELHDDDPVSIQIGDVRERGAAARDRRPANHDALALQLRDRRLTVLGMENQKRLVARLAPDDRRIPLAGQKQPETHRRISRLTWDADVQVPLPGLRRIVVKDHEPEVIAIECDRIIVVSDEQRRPAESRDHVVAR